MTNNVELDTRNLVYIVDRVGSGADIFRLTGSAEVIGQGSYVDHEGELVQ
jgi:hypothetical protein